MTRHIRDGAVVVVLLVCAASTVRAQEGPAGAVNAAAIHRALADVFTPDSPQGQEPPPPKPAHTGFAALAYETGQDFKAFPRRESTWVILGIGGAAALIAHPVDSTVNAHLVGHTWAENLWKPGHIVGGTYVMVGVPIGVYLIGRYIVPPAKDAPQTNKWSHLGFDLVRAQIVDEAFVQGLKYSVRRTRPNGGKYSFPSGHSAATFALAAVLERHLGYRLALPTIAIAAYVGTSRLHDNVHYLSDVLFGAALGTAVGWTVVGRHGRSNYAVAPVPVKGGFAIAVTRVSPRYASRSDETAH
jgi:membrane-associated phospholipid phosphatase